MNDMRRAHNRAMRKPVPRDSKEKARPSPSLRDIVNLEGLFYKAGMSGCPYFRMVNGLMTFTASGMVCDETDPPLTIRGMTQDQLRIANAACATWFLGLANQAITATLLSGELHV